MTEVQPGFWSAVWARMLSVFKWVGVKLLAPGVAVLLIIGVVILVAMGFKEIQIGGLLGKLFGKKEPQKATDVANTVDPDRVDKDGRLIQPGTPDSNGHTQAVVVPIKEPGMFSDPRTVVFTPPGETKPQVVTLPDGVTNRDVEHVIVVSPEIKVVTVKDSSGVPAKTVDDLLKKYGGA